MDEKEKSSKSVIERLKSWIKGGKGLQTIVIVGILGIALIGVSSFLPKNTAARSDTSSSTTKTTEQYKEEIEQELKDLVGSIQGAGQCRVMVTLENGVEYVYASEEKINTDKQQENSKLSQSDESEKKYIVVDTSDGRKGLLVTEIQPTVKGVVVVCQGGDQPQVQQRVINAITAALNISSKRICVTKLSE